METPFSISSIVIIVWLVVPGVLFKKFYYQGHFTKQLSFGLFADRLISSIFWGIIVQIVTFLVYTSVFKFKSDGTKNYIDQAYGDILKNLMPDVTDRHLYYVLIYLALLIFVSCFLGLLAHKIVRGLKMDVRYKVFQFANQWHYYFKGEILSTRDFKTLKRGKVISTLVDVVMQGDGEKSKMISGFLTQYDLSHKTGDLETIYLTSAKRYSATDKKFKDIPGDCFIVPYCKVTDLNLTYNVVQSVSIATKKQNILSVIALIGVLGFIFGLSFPWFLNLSVLNKAFGAITLSISWLLLIALIESPFQEKAPGKLTKQAAWIIFLLFLVCSSLAFFFLIIRSHVTLNDYQQLVIPDKKH